MGLVVLSVVEQRHAAVLEVVKDGRPVTEVAARYGVSRQTLHSWLNRYRSEGLAGLVDRSHRPRGCPHQMLLEVEQVVVALRRRHPGWGPVRLAYELSNRGISPVPSVSAVYRALIRNALIDPTPRRRRREDFRRWEREASMQLWQLDVTAGVQLSDGRHAQLVTGLDDHSRFCVIAAVVERATSRTVCAAFAGALRRWGVPDEVLTDNGKVFTSRFGPNKGPVLFEQICQQNGIQTRLTAPRSPTTTGKIERFHKTVKNELLRSTTFVDLDAAQRAVDAWVDHYNLERPHQAIEMNPPAHRFRPASAPDTRLWQVLTQTPPRLVERRISPVGQARVAGEVHGLGRHLAGRQVTIAIYDTHLKFYVDGILIDTRPRKKDNVRVAAAPRPQVSSITRT